MNIRIIITLMLILSMIMVSSATSSTTECNPSEADLVRIEELKNETMRRGVLLELASIKNKILLNEMSKDSYKEDLENGLITQDQYDGVVSAYNTQTDNLNELKCLLYCECEGSESLSEVEKPKPSEDNFVEGYNPSEADLIRIEELKAEIPQFIGDNYSLNMLKGSIDILNIALDEWKVDLKAGSISQAKYDTIFSQYIAETSSIYEMMCLLHCECEDFESLSEVNSTIEIAEDITEDITESSSDETQNTPGFGIVLALSGFLVFLLRRRE